MSASRIEDLIGSIGFFEKNGATGVLLVHGLTGTPTEMRHLGQRLASRGFTVMCHQLAGHCGTIAKLKASTWQDWYQSVDDAFETLRETCPQVFVVGLSAGALLCLLLAARKNERLKGMALLSPTFSYDGWNVSQLGQKLILPLIIHSPIRHVFAWQEPSPYGIKDERVRAMITTALQHKGRRNDERIGHFSTPGSVIRENQRLIRAAKKCLSEIRQPVLVIHSTEDEMASIKNALYVMGHIGSKQIEALFVDDSYHVLTMDKQKERVATRVGDFIASFSSGTDSNCPPPMPPS